MTQPVEIDGLSAIVDRYDAFLIDQFGVLRDGRGPYPAAPETLSALKARGSKIIILSNSGKRSQENSVRLAATGFDASSWDWFLTSGETAWWMMQKEASHTGKCLLISRDGDISPLKGLDIERTDEAEEADIVLIAASEGDVHPLAHYQALLEPATKRGTPCLCTNPDRVMLTPEGGTAFGAGKPFPDIYDLALEFLGDMPRDRVCCIGDSVEHDIAGAAGAGFASVLVTTGILEHASAEDRAQLFETHGVVPDFILPSLRM
jgi:HAD superfamily hydrolase (TIGR01459 family)